MAPIDFAACRWFFRSFGSTASARPEIILPLEEVVSAFLSRRTAFFQRVLQMASFCGREAGTTCVSCVADAFSACDGQIGNRLTYFVAF